MSSHASALDLPRALVDFETFSEKPLGNKDSVGAWRYAEDPSTEILCMAYLMPGESEPKLWVPGAPFPPELIEHVENGFPIEAHNAAFERAIWEHILHKKMGIPKPVRYLDTMATCAYRAIPMGLDKAGEVLDLDIKKDNSGKLLLNKLSKPQKPTKANPTTRCQDWDMYERLYDYCIRDVEAENSLGKKLGDLPRGEYAVWVLDQKINARGVYVDLDAVHKAKAMATRITDRLLIEFAELMDRSGASEIRKPTQTAKLVQWFKDNGAPNMPNLQASTVEDMLKEDWVKGDVRRVLEIRQNLSKASTKKLDKFIGCTSMDSRIRGLLAYHGAGTGRWAGRLVQPQNFPRGNIGSTPFIKDLLDQAFKRGGKAAVDELYGELLSMDALVDAIKVGDLEYAEWMYGDVMSLISSSLRGMFTAAPGNELLVSDFSAIEARVVMWLAGQDDAIEAFYAYDRGEGSDIYCVMASKLTGYEVNKKDHPDDRQLGKITILGCGYQMGGPRLREQAEVAYGVMLTEDRANFLVNTYREQFPEVPKLWRGLQEEAIRCVDSGRRTQYGMITFEVINDNAGRWLTVILPNGRRLWYLDPETEMKTIPYQDKETGEWKSFEAKQLTYMGRDNKIGGAWNRVSTYGGMMTENIVQAIARDLMVAAMFRVEDAGFKIVMTVHDELVCEAKIGTKKLEDFEAVMKGPNPKWAEGCPINADGWVGKRYRK